MNEEPPFLTSVKAGESHRGKGFLGLMGKEVALVIRVSIDETHPLEKEAKIINEHFINWLKRHEKDCADLILEFRASHTLAEQIVETCSKILDQGLGYDDIVRRLNVAVGVVDPETGETKEFKVR